VQFWSSHKKTSKAIISQLKQKGINIVVVVEEEVAAKPTTGFEFNFVTAN
jgi:hypothetical protein